MIESPQTLYLGMVQTSNVCNTKPYSALLVTSCCAEKIVTVRCMRRFCISSRGGTRGGGWGHPQGDMHVVAARLGCQSTVVGTGWANSHPGCMHSLRKYYSHLVRVLSKSHHVWSLNIISTLQVSYLKMPC